MTLKLRGYTVERLLGRGSSGDVWQARVNGSGARVALKRVHAADEDARRRAQAEAALLAALEHPNLVRLHTVVPADDALVLVLDLADGGSLADLLAARRQLAPGEVITAIAPVAAALAYLHDEGVVHGDVSAANVLFTAAGVPLLADVGVARLTGTDADIAATPAYVDPAVAAGCVPGPPSDVFMLGGVALHALTGEPPWVAESAGAALALAARGVLTDVRERLAAAVVPPAMAAVVARALAVDPHRRGTAADLALDLRHSGQPVAVELAAGRARRDPLPWTGPRHAARPAGAASDDPARPAFERPTSVPAGPEPPTHVVGPRPRPVIPRPVRRRWPSRRVVLPAAALAVALVGAGVVWTQASPPDAARGAASSRPRSEVETMRSTTTPARSPTVAAAPAGWAAVLARLDADRAAAFARRDAGLLRRVYLPGPLLTADTALLTRLVPAGCGLVGARTSYTRIAARTSGARVIVTATATLPPSQLVCGGRVRATAPGAGPTRLRLEVARTKDGPRIAAQTVIAS